MTVNELLEKCKEAAAAGYGSADVYFDSEARQFNCHYVTIDGGASMVTKEETGEKDMFVLYTRYHARY